MLTVVTYLHGYAPVAKALQEGKTVFCGLLDRQDKERVKAVRKCGHLSKREVLTAYGWNHPVQVWIESGADTGTPARALAA